MNKAIYIAAAAMLASCAQSHIDLDVEIGKGQRMVLQMNMQAANSPEFQSATLPSPTTAYIFDANSSCVGTVAVSGDKSEAELCEGSYTVYVASGATVQIKKPQDAIIQTPEVAGDFLLGSSRVTMTAGEDASLDIDLQRQVCMFKSLTLTNIPDDTRNVSVSLDNLYTTLTLDGQLSGYGGKVFALTRSASNTWSTSDACYLLPSKGNVVMAVAITDANSDVTIYETILDQRFDANHKYSITGEMESKVTTARLTITARSNEWEEDCDVSVSFGEANIKDTENPTVGDVPEAGTLYKGAYVLRTVQEGPQTVVTLLTPTYASKESPNKYWSYSDKKYTLNDITSQSNWATCMTSLLSAMSQSFVSVGITSWRLPTLEEATYIAEHRSEISSKIPSPMDFSRDFYMPIYSDGQYSCFDTFEKTASVFSSSFSNKMYLRAVTTVTFQ